MRGHEGAFFAGHVAVEAGDEIRPITEEDLAALLPGIQVGLLAVKDARIAELEAEIAQLQAQLAAALAPAAAGGGISKLTLKRRLDQLGKWAAFKAFLAELGEAAVDEFNLAAEIRSDDPMFVQIAPLAKQALDLSDEQYAALLAA